MTFYRIRRSTSVSPVIHVWHLVISFFRLNLGKHALSTKGAFSARAKVKSQSELRKIVFCIAGNTDCGLIMLQQN